jgi:hypothetical protein
VTSLDAWIRRVRRCAVQEPVVGAPIDVLLPLPTVFVSVWVPIHAGNQEQRTLVRRNGDRHRRIRALVCELVLCRAKRGQVDNFVQ